MAAAIAMAAMADVAGRRKMAEFFFLSAVGVWLTRPNPTRKLNENHDPPPYLSERCCNPRSFNTARPRNQPRPLQPASEPAARDPLHTAASSDDPWRERRRRARQRRARRERRRRERRRRPRTATSTYTVMEEQFILRVPPNVAERIERLLNENNASSSEDKSLDLSFREDGRSGTFMIGNEQFPASLLDLPCVVESYKTYDDNSLIKTADIGQMIMVRESGDAAPDVIEYRHGLTPPMRDARKRRFRREPDLNPELVSRVEKDLLKIMAGGTADNLDVETAEQEEGDENARGANKKSAPKPAPKHDIPENLTNAGEADRSDSEESDDSV
ncbi:hypothetical protein AAZX31_06G289500 [Glycine max]